ncbi:MAG: hypothetical protein Q9227_001280 [Pyrenula ochraceoflavens]
MLDLSSSDAQRVLLDTPKRVALSSKTAALRADLKQWERNFANTNRNHKASKSDIKQHPEIAAKYKEYNRLRDILCGKASDIDEPLSSPKSYPSRAPNQRRELGSTAQFTTPRKDKPLSNSCSLHPNNLDPYDAPSLLSPQRYLPHVQQAIGPTPHRDGKALGLFDLLSRSGSSQPTPSSRKRKAEALQEVHGNTIQTPSKKLGQVDTSSDLLAYLTGDENAVPSRERQSRTPASHSKKFMLSKFFATPSTDRFRAVIDIEREKSPVGTKTPYTERSQNREKPTTSTPSHFTQSAPSLTPAFLKRSSFNQRLVSALEKPDSMYGSSAPTSFSSPERVRTGPRDFRPRNGRSLSEILTHLRKIDDENDNDDLDALRELESGPQQLGSQVGDSQDKERVGASVHLAEGIDYVEEHGQSAHVWKKKGQKRTTRKINMKPSCAKPVEAPKWIEEESEDELTAVLETQAQEMLHTEDGTSEQSGEEGRADQTQYELKSYIPENLGKRSQGRTPKVKLAHPVGQGPDANLGRNPVEVKRRTYNPNATSHLNFRSLKIKNRNSKARRGGFRGKLGRRR